MTLMQHRIDGPGGAPPIILGPSIGTSTHLWDRQVEVLARGFRVLRFDLPGHAGAPFPAGDATVGALAERVLDLADAYGFDAFHYAGVSLGGAIGATLAVEHPKRIRSLAMVCSSARFGEPGPWRERAAAVRANGIADLVEPTSRRWFATPIGELGSRLLDDLRTVDPAAYAWCCDALAAYDLRDRLGEISTPTLVVCGRDDPATPPPHGREVADGVADARLIEIPKSAHLAPVDQPDAVTQALLGHVGPSAHDGGMAVRRAVLGDAHVDRAGAATTPFTADFQDFITRYAWGAIWTRPGLDRRTRSVITLTALVARGHHDELAMHVRGAVHNGLSADEIKEVLLQTAVYCGVPAANSAFAVAARVLESMAPADE